MLDFITYESIVCTLMGAKKEAVRRSSGVWKIVNSSGETVLASDKKDVS